MSGQEGLSREDREAITLAEGLRRDGDTAALIAALKGGDGGPARARDSLELLGELDPELLVQLALEVLIAAHLRNPAEALRTRRIVRRDIT